MRRSAFVAMVLGTWTALTAHAGPFPLLRVWPDTAFPCNGTLQACIDGSDPDDTIEIATNGPIDESITITENLSLVAAFGFQPVFAAGRNVHATSPNSDRAFWIEGLTLESGWIVVQNPIAGSLIATVRNNRCRSIRVRGVPNADMHFSVADNEVAPIFGDIGGIIVEAENAFGDGEIVRNTVAMPSDNDAYGISVEAENGGMDVDVVGNRVTGSLYERGIHLARTGPAPFAARVVNNLVAGATASGYGIYAGGTAGDGATDVFLVNNTVVDNTTGVIVSFIDAVIANNLVAGNATMGFSICPTGGATVVNRNNLVFDNGDDFFVCDAGPGTVFADPRFVDEIDFRPNKTSPAIDAGDDSAVPLGVTTDLAGNPRKNETVDIGAYEVPEPGWTATVAVWIALCARARRRTR